MQSRILVKPNLKLILLGALLIAVLHDVFTSGRSQPYFRQSQFRASWLSDKEFGDLIEEAETYPSSSAYMLISQMYEKRGDMRKAILYIRKADAMGAFEEPED